MNSITIAIVAIVLCAALAAIAPVSRFIGHEAAPARPTQHLSI